MADFQNIAVENTILNLLAACETNYEFPLLQSQALDAISSNITDIVYTTLKQKSIASSTKRCNLLKFINNLCKTPEIHLTQDHYKIYLNQYKEEFCKSSHPEAEDLLFNISRELHEISTDVHSRVVEFYKRKNAKRKNKIKKQEFIKHLDQEQLSANLDMQLLKSVSHYETSRSLIDELLKESGQKLHAEGSPTFLQSNAHREKQVQFCYAIVNLSSDPSDLKILESVLERISGYGLLERFEIKLLSDLWLLNGNHFKHLSDIVAEKFPYVIEKMVTQFCLDIIKLKDECEVSKYFLDLHDNPKILKLQDFCTRNLSFYSKLKNLIYELYVFSYCNENVYRFSDYII